MTQKRFESKSNFNKYDKDGDGIITDEELSNMEAIEEIERLNRKQKHQRMMAWYALVGMISYPACIIFCEFVGLNQSAKLLADLAPTYFIAAAGIAGAFMGISAWSESKRNSSTSSKPIVKRP
tara:strand:- start:17156 stop:17524 length:369 start_codon:yes stop_codon:yes gene_type:complete